MPDELSFSVIIPTQGRQSLLRTIHSISQQQHVEGDEVLVMADGAGPEINDARLAIEALDGPYRLVEGPRTSDWGHSQLNTGMEIANAKYILAMDDDDVYTPRAFERIRSLLSSNPLRLHLFRFWTNDRCIRWDKNYKRIGETWVGGHNLICPNIKGKVGKWTSRYMGDLDWIKSVVAEHDDPPIWAEPIIVRQRPRSELREWRVNNPERLEELRLARNECTEFMTGFRGQVTPGDQTTFGLMLEAQPENHYAYVYTHPEHQGETVGFVYMGRRGPSDHLHLSYGLREKFRGLGYGRWLIESAIDSTDEVIEAHVLRSNLPSLYSLKDQGFREYGPGPDKTIAYLERQIR